MADFPSRSNRRLSAIPFFDRFIGTGFFSGYAPVAPGTVGSAAAMLFFLIPSFSQWYVLVPATIAMFALGGRAAEKFERLLGQDPSAVTADEVAGMWMSLWFVPLTPYTAGAAFFLFRFFDIVKPSPARYFDSKSGGWNIMLDDVIAALYTNLLLQIGLRVF